MAEHVEFAKLPNSWHIGNLSLPEWFTIKIAKQIFDNKFFQENLQNYADSICEDYPTFAEGHYSTGLSFTEGCGLQYVSVFPGNATSLGISTGEWREGSINLLEGNNIDSPVQALLLYQIWAHYLNLLEVLHRSKD